MNHCQGKSLGCWQGVFWAEVRYCKIVEFDQKHLKAADHCSEQ
jgi:hypothetical protein